jgi:hypothetical protein
MNNEQFLCKIIGDDQIDKLKKRLWRIQLNVGSLENALHTLQRIYNEFQKPQDQPDGMLLEAFTCYSVVLYTKCFNSDLSDKLDSSIFDDTLSESAAPDQLSEREFHNMVMNYRNMHLVHCDALLKVADTGGFKFSDENFAVAPIVASRIFQENASFYQGLNSLAVKALNTTKNRLEAAQNKLIEAIKSGQGTISNEHIQMIPISDKITPRELWGLPPRSK